MRKTLSLLLLLAAALALCSCSAARKPAPPQNKTYIVPDVTRATFDTVDLKTAPKVVRDMARQLENRDAAAWAQYGGKSYLIISQGEKTGKYDLKVDEVLQRLPEQGFTWLEVKLVYKGKNTTGSAGGTGSTATPPQTVVRVDVGSAPLGVGFTASGPGAAGTAPGGGAPPAAVTPPAPQQAPAAQPGASISQPAPNQEITSPVKVSGTAKSQGQLRVRISTRGGQVLKEEKLVPAGSGAFSLNMSYSPPAMPTPGEISVISAGGGGESTLVRVPVVIK